MRTKEQYNEYMKAYMQNRRDTQSYEQWRRDRDRDNATRRQKYKDRTEDKKAKDREYQKNKQRLYTFLKQQKK